MSNIVRLIVFIAAAVLMAGLQPRAAAAFDMPSIELQILQSSDIIMAGDSLHPDGPHQRRHGVRQRRHATHRRAASGYNRWSRSYSNSALHRSTRSSYRYLHPDGPPQGQYHGGGNRSGGKYRYDGGSREDREKGSIPPRVFPSF